MMIFIILQEQISILHRTRQGKKEHRMAQQHPAIEFQDIPLEDARTMGRGPRMDPFLYKALKSKIQSLAKTAARMNLPEGVNATTMKNRILRVAAELNVPVTVRRVLGGLLFWRSTDQDLKQAKEVAMRLQAAQRKGRARRGRRRRA
jgi:hypothetical protein